MALSFNDVSPYPFFLARKTATQTISTSGVAVTFETAIQNPGGYYSTTTSLFTAPVTGLYQFSFVLTVGGPGSQAVGTDNIRLVISGGTSTSNLYGIYESVRSYSNSTRYYSTSNNAIIYLLATQTVSVFTSSISSATVFPANVSYFSGHLITPFF